MSSEILVITIVLEVPEVFVGFDLPRSLINSVVDLDFHKFPSFKG